jgi:signal transduction histidine kinase
MPSVMIVEDERIVAEELKRTLERMGHGVVGVASSSEDAAALASERSPDLVLMDVRLEGRQDGIETAHTLQQQFRVPVIYLTAFADPLTIKRARETEPYGYLIKPFSDKQLQTSIEIALYKHEMDARLRAAENEARNANRVKDEFLATLSHELRTPLSAILGWSTMLAEGRLDASHSRRAVQSITRSARNLAQLVDDVLDVSRVVNGSLRLDVESVLLTSVIEAAVDTARPAAEVKSIDLSVVVDRSEVVVSGDRGRLQQIVGNLLSNAVKFTAKGGHVRVTLERANSWAELVVSDTGRGIDPEFLPFVFERFRQADGKTTRSVGGLGLGLAIVRDLVELHGGTVRAESPGENLGATFVVRLPIRAVRPDRRQLPPALRSAAAPEEDPDAGDSPDLRGITLLIVDDDSETRELVTTIVGRAGASTTAAASAAEALDILADTRPDLIICDVAMPDQDGYSFIRNIRSRSEAEGGRVPAIALTAHARAEDRRHSLLAGFQGHVAKPAEPTELVALIATLVGRTGISTAPPRVAPE